MVTDTGTVAPRARAEHLDIAKCVLVALVVIGHLVEQVRWMSPASEALYRWIYLFHIPALAWVSGAVASPRIDLHQGRRLLAGLLLPYLVFQALYLWADAHWNGQAFGYRVTQPYWLLWYLVSLMAWRLMLPVALAVGRPLLVAVLVALAAGWLADIAYPFSFSRTLVFFPFFLAGHLHGVQRPRGPAWLAWALLAASMAVAWWLRAHTPLWFYGSVGYAELGARPWVGTSARLFLLLVGFAATWAVLRLLPARAAWVAWLGRWSIGAYLLHGFAVRHAAAEGWYGPLGTWHWALALLCLATVGLVLTVVSCVLSRWCKPLMDYGWLWRRQAPER